MAAHEPDLQLLYDIARSRLDTQLAFLDSLDSKLGLLLSVAAAVLAITGGVATVEHARWTVWTALATALSIGAFFGLGYWTITGLRSQRWGIGPEIVPVAAVMKRSGDREAQRVAINTLKNAFAENIPAYDAKVNAIFPASIALAVESVAALAALLSIVAHPGATP